GADLYRLSQCYILCADPPSATACRLNRLMVSRDGLAWQVDPAPCHPSTYSMPQLSVGVDFMLGADGYWYSVMGGNTDCGAQPGSLASELVVYRSASMWADVSTDVEVGCLGYTDTGGAGRYVSEQGFFRDMDGNEIQGPDRE